MSDINFATIILAMFDCVSEVHSLQIMEKFPIQLIPAILQIGDITLSFTNANKHQVAAYPRKSH